MGLQVVPLRISREVLERVDKLVELGVFNSRSEALRELIKLGLRNYEKMTRIARAVELLFKLEKEGNGVPVKLKGSLKQLLEERSSRRYTA